MLAVAALGAWCGDQLAYALGRALGTRALPALRGTRGRRAVEWATRSLDRRGASVVLGARFVPVGRTAVNVTAGAVGFSRRRFMALSAVASVTWATYSVVIGTLAAAWVGDSPLLAVVVGVVGASCSASSSTPPSGSVRHDASGPWPRCPAWRRSRQPPR